MQQRRKALKQNSFCCCHQELSVRHLAWFDILAHSCDSMADGIHACFVGLQSLLHMLTLLQLPLCLVP